MHNSMKYIYTFSFCVFTFISLKRCSSSKKNSRKQEQPVISGCNTVINSVLIRILTAFKPRYGDVTMCLIELLGIVQMH